VPPSAIGFNRDDKSGTDAYRSRLSVDRATNAADKQGTIMMRGWPVLVLGMALAGCGTQGGSNETAAANTTATSQGSGYIAKVLALPPRQLNGVLYRAIDDAKQSCQGIADTLRQKDNNGKPVWAVRCTDGGAWLITIGDDGTADVTGVPAKAGG